MIYNILLTRKCNLNCNYCSITKMDNMEQSLREKLLTELPEDDWLNFFQRMYKFYNGDVFFILYGGEPTLYKHFNSLITKLSKSELKYNYTVISNMTDIAKEKIDEVIDLLPGITASVDPVTETDGDRFVKSQDGLKYLISQKKKHPNLDVVAEVVVDKTNYKQLPFLLTTLTNAGIWASISTIEYKVNSYYDFAGMKYNEFLFLSESDQRKLSDIIVNEVKRGKLIHAPEAVLNVLSKPVMGTDCSLTNTMTVEPNGQLRLCLRIRGYDIASYSINDIPDKFDSIMKTLRIEKRNFCQGCSWTCPHMVNVIHKDGKSVPTYM